MILWLFVIALILLFYAPGALFLLIAGGIALGVAWLFLSVFWGATKELVNPSTPYSESLRNMRKR